MGRGSRSVLAAAAALAAGLALSACGEGEARRAPCPAGLSCLEWGNGSEPLSLDPAFITGTWEDRIVGNMILGLTQEDAEGRPIPGMAERWETSEDGLVWTFHLRQATWSDGVPVTAGDFVYGMRRLLDPKTAAEYASLLYFIQGAQAVNDGSAPPQTLGVEAVDARTLRIALTHPAPFLTELAAHQTMFPVPRHVVEKLGDAWTQPQNYVSNGPYRLAEWRLGDRVRVVKNPRFYEADQVCFDEIRFYPTTDSISAERRVRRGELDLNNDIQSNRIEYLLRPDQIPAYVRVHTYLGTAYMAFNTRDVAAFKDVRVRQALAMAVDREFIAEKLLRGGQVPAVSFVPPGAANYRPGVRFAWADMPFEARQAEARRLLAEAGYGPSNPLKIEIKHRNSADPSLYMQAVQADWRQIGVDVGLMSNEVQIAYASYRTRDFHVADAGWIGDYNDPMSFLYLQKSDTGAQNYADYHNPRFDRLLTLAQNEPDVERRAAYLAEAEQLMLDEAPVVPVYHYVNKNLVNPAITGWVDNLTDKHRARYLCRKG